MTHKIIASLLESVIAEAMADPNELIPTEKLPSAIKIIERVQELEQALRCVIGWCQDEGFFKDGLTTMQARTLFQGIAKEVSIALEK